MSNPLAFLRRLSGMRLGLRRTLVVALTLLATLFVAAPSAQAATFNPNLTRHFTWGDCTLSVGVVPDTLRPAAAIGGATVSCSTRHTYASATVTLKFNGSPVVGSSRSTNYTNSYGFGGNILTTPRFCGTGYWQVVVTFNISGLGQTFVTNGAPTYWRAC